MLIKLISVKHFTHFEHLLCVQWLRINIWIPSCWIWLRHTSTSLSVVSGQKSPQTQQLAAAHLPSQVLWVRPSETASVSALHRAPSQLCFYVHWAVFSSGGLTRGKSTFMFIAAVSGIWFLGIVGLGHSVMLLPVSRRPPPGFKSWPLSPWSSETKLFLCFVSMSLPQGLELLWYNIKSHQARS